MCGENNLFRDTVCHKIETPPRVWRKPPFDISLLSLSRNTSTCVEKTHRHRLLVVAVWKHLHVCGENLGLPQGATYGQETPPRVWRKLHQTNRHKCTARNTSTCVEKTFFSFSLIINIRKHLHVCGENSLRKEQHCTIAETPPRVWRKHRPPHLLHLLAGNTSTCVEKTFYTFFKTTDSKKHLHVCGENTVILFIGCHSMETPPRVWRKLCDNLTRRISSRNTSTCVEKTHSATCWLSVRQKHLHVCGENFFSPCGTKSAPETPPRVWRKL